MPFGYVNIAMENDHVELISMDLCIKNGDLSIKHVPIKSGDFPELCQFARGYFSMGISDAYGFRRWRIHL